MHANKGRDDSSTKVIPTILFTSIHNFRSMGEKAGITYVLESSSLLFACFLVLPS